jgi:hypothetical protein
VEIIKDCEALFFQETPGGICFQLYPESGTDFFCLERPEEITFIKDAKGNVEAMMIGEHSYLERVENGSDIGKEGSAHKPGGGLAQPSGRLMRDDDCHLL